MKLAHLADLHLGFRQFTRQNDRGINQREADVGEALRLAVGDLIEQTPDLIAVAGDVFHSVRPTNTAIVFAFRQLARLRSALPETPIILLAGNHDTPRSTETGSILRLFEALGVYVVDGHARRLEFPAIDTSVLAVPHQPLVSSERPALRPDGSAAIQILLTHGEIEGVIGTDRGQIEYGGALLSNAEMGYAHWSYIALGHYHIAHEVRPNAWYAGSLDYVSNTIWSEVRAVQEGRASGKGYLLVDLPDGKPTIRPVGPVRPHIDLTPVEGKGLSPSELDEEIRARVQRLGDALDDAVVRLVLWDVARDVARDLDHAQIRAYKSRALQFTLDIRRPEPVRTAVGGAPMRRQPLPEIVKTFLAERLLESDIPREDFVRVGLEYLDRAMQDDEER